MTPTVGIILIYTGVRATKMRSESVTRDDGAPERKRLRILIVEDHLGSQQALQLLLRWLGCRADVSDNGQEALEAVRTREYDIILMDVVMPRMDGLEATRRIRQDRALISQPRIVGMSADTMPEDQETCFAAGMDEFLPKPIDVDSLIRILDEAALGLSAVS
jgi:CheY-like chemotaxis protein